MKASAAEASSGRPSRAAAATAASGPSSCSSTDRYSQSRRRSGRHAQAGVWSAVEWRQAFGSQFTAPYGESQSERSIVASRGERAVQTESYPACVAVQVGDEGRCAAGCEALLETARQAMWGVADEV